MKQMKAIDVSEFQGKINWNKVKDSGIEAVVIRAGYGRGNVDDGFYANITGAIAAGLHIGIYWFSYAYNENMARNEADYVNDILKGYKQDIDLPVFHDWEYDSMDYAKENGVYPNRNLITAMTKAFCERIEELGYTAGYYLNIDYSRKHYDESRLTQYKKWFADIDGNASPADECYLWQYSFDGVIDGINGDVDTDILFGELCPVTPKPAPEPTPEPVHDNYYKVDEVYTVNVRTALNVRTGPGTDYPMVGYNNLTPDGKAHAYDNGALMPGTRVTCLEVRDKGDEVWIRIPSGWICAKCGDSRYVVS